MGFWEQLVAAAIGAIVGGGIAALIARWTFERERSARSGELAAEVARGEAQSRHHEALALDDRKRRRVSDVLDTLIEMTAFVATSDDMNAARGVAARLTLRVEALAIEESEDDRRRFAAWAMDIHESFLAMVEWEGDATGWRSKTDQFRRVLYLSTEQIVQWARGTATAHDLLLVGPAGEARFLRGPHYSTRMSD